VTVCVLAIDLGTSRVKVGVIDETLTTLASASRTYETISDDAGMAEQRTDDWLHAIHDATRQVVDDGGHRIDAVVLTAQMPTMVSLTRNGQVMGNAVTWQDARADSLVDARLDVEQRRRVNTVAGTPIDGRYIIPMHLFQRRSLVAPAVIMSAKDYLYSLLTATVVTDPSTASGFGAFSLETNSWSDELLDLWGVSHDLLPEIVPPTSTAPLVASGEHLVPGVVPGTPVFVGGADSVCAHHFVAHHFANAISVIDGSSNVIMGILGAAIAPDGLLITPLVDPRLRALELDLLATGSSLNWLAQLFEVQPEEVERLALDHPRPHENDLLFYPYLAGGEQGTLWRTDISGSLQGLGLSHHRADLALALFEGIAFETQRCLEVLNTLSDATTVVAVARPTSELLGARLLQTLTDLPVVAVQHQSPSLTGAAIIALGELGATSPKGDAKVVAATVLEPFELDYAAHLRAKAARYLDAGPTPRSGLQ
jgi:xylulokinase